MKNAGKSNVRPVDTGEERTTIVYLQIHEVGPRDAIRDKVLPTHSGFQQP